TGEHHREPADRGPPGVAVPRSRRRQPPRRSPSPRRRNALWLEVMPQGRVHRRWPRPPGRPGPNARSSTLVEVSVLDSGAMAPVFELPGDLLGDGDRAMTAAGAPERHGQIRLALGFERRHDQVEKPPDLVDEGLGQI